MISRFSALTAVVCCLGLCTLAASAQAADPRRYALVVGANSGELREATLRYAEDDAEHMAQVLTQALGTWVVFADVDGDTHYTPGIDLVVGSAKEVYVLYNVPKDTRTFVNAFVNNTVAGDREFSLARRSCVGHALHLALIDTITVHVDQGDTTPCP